MGKESAYNAEDTRDLGSTPGSGRSPRVGNGNHSGTLVCKIQWKEGTAGYKESDMTECLMVSKGSGWDLRLCLLILNPWFFPLGKRPRFIVEKAGAA